MATVGALFPTTDATQAADAASSGAGSANGAGSSGGSSALANESTFLQLLVAQLQNQDPMQPMDGTTFITQLAQFSDLEQNVAMRGDLDALRAQYVPDPTQSQATGDGGADTGAANANASQKS